MKAVTYILYGSALSAVHGIPLPDGTISSAASTVTSIPPSDFGANSSSTSVSNSSVASTFPAGTKNIAVNEGAGNLAAYDTSGELLGNVAAAAPMGKNTTSPKAVHVGSGALAAPAAAAATTVNTCRPATNDDLPLIPGYQALSDAGAKHASGQKPTRIYVNDPSYPNIVATLCYSTDTVTLAPNGSPSCSTQVTNLKLDQTSDGQPITVSHGVVTGFKSDVSTTTTKTSQFNWSDTITAKASIPEVMEVSSVQTFAVQVVNTQGTQTSTSIDSQTSDTVKYTSKPGKDCPVHANVTTCTYEATGSLPVYLTGNIWFEYKDWFRDPGCTQSLIQPGAPCAGKGDHPKNDLNHCYDNNDCKTHGHWAWDLASDLLPNIDDRSNPIQFTNGFQSTDTGSYDRLKHNLLKALFTVLMNIEYTEHSSAGSAPLLVNDCQHRSRLSDTFTIWSS
ncbi:hypothetical protein B0H19DRAFT_1274147 [Mycena capillaripes]|nr:hypothetical protein B0H19DRAFT_1274147 [Mycena capillaripes]